MWTWKLHPKYVFSFYLAISGMALLYVQPALSSDVQTPFKQAPSADDMLSKLKSAFGGQNKLDKIQTFSADLQIIKPGETAKKSKSFYDFTNIRAVEAYEDEWIIATAEHSVLIRNKRSVVLPEVRRTRILENMKLNFLYFLRNPGLTLSGPLDIPEHKELSWWQLQVDDHISLPLGLNRENGQIKKVLFADGRYVLESNYQPLKAGVYWPYKFQLYEQEKLVLEGTYSNVKLNTPPGFATPDWFSQSP